MKIMKKQSIYALMSAIALAGAVGFSSCSSDEKVTATPNPGYNQTEGTVPVQFLFNVGSYGSGASTRQDADATQATNNLPAEKFRGIEGARILCFKLAENGQYVASSTTGEGPSNVKAAKDFNMARVAQPGSLGNGTNSTSTRVLEMTFPLGTNSMIFYGRAVPPSYTTEQQKKLNYNTHGLLDEYTIDEELPKVTFALGKRLPTAEKEVYQHIQNLLASIMTCVMETNRGTSSVTADQTPEEGVVPYGFAISTETAQNLKWREYYSAYMSGTAETKAKSPVDNTTNLTELEIKLAKAYKEMTTIQPAELRNGSGPAMQSTIKSLWGIVNSVRCANPTEICEAVAKYMAERIHQELLTYFTPQFEGDSQTHGGTPSKVSLKDVDVLLTKIEQDAYWPKGKENGKNIFPENYFSGISNTAHSNLNLFPSTFDLPQGATHIQFCTLEESNTTDRAAAGIPAGIPQYGYYYVQNYNSSAVNNGQFTVDDYYYPAELLYFGNSPIRVSDQDHEVLDYPQKTTDWINEEKWPAPSGSDPEGAKRWTTGGSVSSTTRSVAMKNNINYGTALLDMTVGYSSTTLKDNNKAIQQRDYQIVEEDNTITVTDNSFKLVGVLVGDQFPRIGWDMLPALKNTERKGYIYDNKIAFSSIPVSGSSGHNYTMVFDNYNASSAANAQDKVFIALEFQNNSGVDFFGKDNMIANGSNFYLIGELDPTSKDGIAFPAYHALPPYGAHAVGDESKTVPRVFIQDHKTMVNFKIGLNSLKSAYLTVPDLRSSSVTLGLSVDMSWETGLNFDDIELGGTGN